MYVRPSVIVREDNEMCHFWQSHQSRPSNYTCKNINKLFNNSVWAYLFESMVSGSLIINKYILKPKYNRFLHYEPLEKRELLRTEIDLSKEVAGETSFLYMSKRSQKHVPCSRIIF